ncbi:MAG TPA: phosphate transport system regulatory protein PhoU [Acidimicrobiaceae bacterium]|nr:phosphate transport system regulatory protein PhoU [Acidimicrobiaceae bacterium]
MNELRKAFHADLETARSQVVRMAATVVETVGRATAVLLDGDLETAEYVIRGDAELDARAVECEEHCIEILALQAPVAGDLRQVLAIMKMISDIERSGDLAAGICKATRRIYGHHELEPKLRGLITKMGEQAQTIYKAAIEAFQENDVAKAAAVDDMDAYLDALQKQFIQAMFECSAAGKLDIQEAIELAKVARFYERIGDHAVHIAERVRYVLTGWLPDHRKPDRPDVVVDVDDVEGG